MNKILPVLILLLLLLSHPSFAETLEGRVIAITDGDTITVLSTDKQQVKVRLDSIDSPEKKQAFGTAAKKALSDMVFNKQVVIESSKIDRYGRTVGTIWVDGLLVNLEMVKTGMAWVYRKYATNQAYYDAEEIAKSDKVGLWSQPNQVPPWDFRHGGVKNIQPQNTQQIGAACQGKRYCTQMLSCDEAKYYLNGCGLNSLDKDGDGVPCESLCK
ncbi:MAG: thermonuclease family protein [Methylococcales bacterium]